MCEVILFYLEQKNLYKSYNIINLLNNKFFDIKTTEVEIINNIDLSLLKEKFKNNTFNYDYDIARQLLSLYNFFDNESKKNNKDKHYIILFLDNIEYSKNLKKNFSLLIDYINNINYDIIVIDDGTNNSEDAFNLTKIESIEYEDTNGIIINSNILENLSNKMDLNYKLCNILNNINPKLNIYKSSHNILEKKINSDKNIEGYNYYCNLDSINYDICYQANKSIDELKKICDEDENCLGFNTLGYLKYKIQPINKFVYLREGMGTNNGLYVKKNDDIIKNKIKKILEKKLNGTVETNLTFTITTCKRLDSFIKTIDTLLVTCKDIEIVDKWLCVDDNSTEYDREIMKKKYPFFDFIMKNIEQKGHAKSMNIILNNVTTDYVLHFEDDWICQDNFYILPLLEYIKKYSFGQLILRNISQNYERLYIKTINGKKIYKYIYNPKNKHKPPVFLNYDKEYSYDNLNSDKYNDNNYWWWPGFTLNPSIFNLSMIKEKIGYFDENIKPDLFEYEYSLRCYLGNISIFFIDLYFDHIGIISSYTLNDTKRAYD